MDYVSLCPICATPSTDRHEEKCSGCGSKRNPVYVCLQLTKAVKLLIKLGLGVLDTDFKYCTSHKTKITITLAGNVPEGIFSDVPTEWQLLYSKEMFYLRCNEINSATMINKLEEWLEDKDADGFKSVLLLSGYSIDS